MKFLILPVRTYQARRELIIIYLLEDVKSCRVDIIKIASIYQLLPFSTNSCARCHLNHPVAATEESESVPLVRKTQSHRPLERRSTSLSNQGNINLHHRGDYINQSCSTEDLRFGH